MKVTFDSNVWRIVSSPASFPNEPLIDSFAAIRAAIVSGKVEAYLSETVFTLEAIENAGRRTFFASYKPKFDVHETAGANGSIHASFAIGPDLTAHPGNSHYLAKHWADAQSIGFRVLHCPRIATTKNTDIAAECFVPLTHELAERFGACGRDITEHGCGIAQLQAIGRKYASDTRPWHSGIADAPSSEDGAIAKAVAEWADGDTVAASYAYSVDYICTRDAAKSAGNTSVFSNPNKQWLKQSYAVEVITPVALGALV